MNIMKIEVLEEEGIQEMASMTSRLLRHQNSMKIPTPGIVLTRCKQLKGI